MGKKLKEQLSYDPVMPKLHLLVRAEDVALSPMRPWAVGGVGFPLAVLLEQEGVFCGVFFVALNVVQWVWQF